MNRNSGLKTLGFALGAGAVLSAIGYFCYKSTEKTDVEDLKEACIYMAVMDDEISRNELGGSIIDGEELELMPRRESLKYRYDLFDEMYSEYSKFKLEREIKKMEKHLEKSKDCISAQELGLYQD